MCKKKTTEEFIKEAKQIHGDKYDYSKTDYINREQKIIIVCPEHGEFLQAPYAHLKGQGCPKCGQKYLREIRKSNIQEFIEKANKIHHGIYDYSKVDYKDAISKVCIICSIHGEFWQTPHSHLDGSKCPKCNRENQIKNYSKTTEDFITESINIHGDKYDYSKTIYKNYKTPVDIICKRHGVFKQWPGHHLNGSECPECARERRSLSKREFIILAQKIYNNSYDYSNVIYYNNRSKVKIKCLKHGIFEQTPNEHLNGRGCPKCYKRKSQLILYNRLVTDLNIDLGFDTKVKWLGLQSLDIYSEKYNFAIEYNGIQHYKPIEFFGGKQRFLENCFRDAKKEFLCQKNKCKLFIVKYNYTEEDYQNLLKEIKQLINERTSNSKIYIGKTKDHNGIFRRFRARFEYDNGCLARIRSGEYRWRTRPNYAISECIT